MLWQFANGQRTKFMWFWWVWSSWIPSSIPVFCGQSTSRISYGMFHPAEHATINLERLRSIFGHCNPQVVYAETWFWLCIRGIVERTGLIDSTKGVCTKLVLLLHWLSTHLICRNFLDVPWHTNIPIYFHCSTCDPWSTCKTQCHAQPRCNPPMQVIGINWWLLGAALVPGARKAWDSCCAWSAGPSQGHRWEMARWGAVGMDDESCGEFSNPQIIHY